MGEDATLGDFLGTPDRSSGHNSGTDESTGDDRGRPSRDDPDVEPAETTYAFAPDGEPCEMCGTTVGRRWQQEGALVCTSCKEW